MTIDYVAILQQITEYEHEYGYGYGYGQISLDNKVREYSMNLLNSLK